MYVHPQSWSPDPTYGRKATPLNDSQCAMALFPLRIVHVWPETENAHLWGAALDLFDDPGDLVLKPDPHDRVDIILDFGTELDASLELCITTGALCNVTAFFGESLPEAQGLVPGGVPRPDLMWHVPGAGVHSHHFDAIKSFGQTIKKTQRGFRYIRLLFQDVTDHLTINNLVAHARFTFLERLGDFHCSDELFQHVWQASLYTARLCTRPDAFWDGIKRDRIGWFGDARITKAAVDSVFFDPRPAEAMFDLLPTDDWGNGIPNYSFDAIAMLKQHVLTFGLDVPEEQEGYDRIAKLLRWAKATQTNEDGFIVRTDRSYFGDIGFLDWSEMPVGGRLEELSWLQCKYVEGLRDAACLARWLGRPDDAGEFGAEADRLAARVIDAFWRPAVGFIHTLNHVGPVANPHLPGGDGHYQRTYIDKIALGPSGPTRQANALAVWAGICSPEMRKTILDNVFDSENILPIVTAYFTYYEQAARAECGDPAGAIIRMRDYVGAILQNEDASTIWEKYDPRITDLRKYYGHFELGWDWPLSLCHGWGSGAVPLALRYLLGIRPAGPGFGSISIAPALEIPWAFEATVPTPHGIISVERSEESGPVRYALPGSIELEGEVPDGVTIEKA